jgi:ribA/ribD-fused uncharacterized protein
MEAKIMSIVQHDEHNIRGLFLDYRFLSNFEFCPNGVEFEGLTYMSSEAAYQSAKIAVVQDRKPFTLLHGKESKQAGRRIEEIRPDWNDVKVDVMHRVLTSKFTRNIGLKNMLIDTGDKYIAEDNYWGDVFWGICNGEGENMLGKLLMQVREELKSVKNEAVQLF